MLISVGALSIYAVHPGYIESRMMSVLSFSVFVVIVVWVGDLDVYVAVPVSSSALGFGVVGVMDIVESGFFVSMAPMFNSSASLMSTMS